MTVRKYVVENLVIPSSKTCNHCHEDKSISGFHKWSYSTDGHHDWCKSCRAAHAKTVASATRKRFEKWYAANKVAHRAGNKRWIANNYERYRFYQNNFQNARRQLVLSSTDTPLTIEQWQGILLTFNNACAYCLKEHVPLEQEHMNPISKGGTHTADNVIPACRKCNASKNNKSFLEFAAGVKFIPQQQKAA